MPLKRSPTRGNTRIAQRLALAGLVALGALADGLAFADTFQVTKIADTRDGACDSDCSLREAIIAANHRPGPDTVIVPTGTYLLRQAGRGEDEARAGDLDILDDLTVLGAGAGTTRIDGSQIDRVFEIHGAAVVRLSGLTVQNGSPGGADGGGGIYNSGTLMVEDCTLSDNSAHNGGGIHNAGTLTVEHSTLSGNSAVFGGGIGNDATLTVKDSTLSGNWGGGIYTNTGTVTLAKCTLSGNSGGGIYISGGTVALTNCTLSDNSGGSVGGGISNAGMLMVEACTLSGNSADNGGGIYNARTLTVKDSTLSGNSAHNGGGIYDAGVLTVEACTLNNNLADHVGGGVYTNAGTLTAEDATLSGNSAGGGGGIYNLGGMVKLTDCTLSNNSATFSGGGISNHGTTTLTNTIIANTPRGGNCDEPLQSNGHNLDDDGGCGLVKFGDLSIVTAHLAPLGDYGGPTETVALCAGPGVPDPSCTAKSPAIDAGDSAQCPSTDQRGAPRPQGSACDIGAYESSAQPSAIPTPTPVFRPCVGDCSGTGVVSISNLITGVDIALGSLPVSACPAFENAQRKVDIAQLIKGVRNALNGCGVDTAQ